MDVVEVVDKENLELILVSELYEYKSNQYQISNPAHF